MKTKNFAFFKRKQTAVFATTYTYKVQHSVEQVFVTGPIFVEAIVVVVQPKTFVFLKKYLFFHVPGCQNIVFP